MKFPIAACAKIRHKPNHNMRKSESPSFNRRQFLRRTGAGAALFYLAPSAVLAAAPRVAVNDKVNVAGIGVGSQG